MLSLCVLCALVALAQCRGEDWKVVETQQGPVKGYLSKEGNYFEFFGIPYATAPKGNDKFKAPLDPPSWTNVLEATNQDIICPQGKFKILPIDLGTQNEDCLLINVFVPNTDKKNFPVMVHIHGGGFLVGAGKMLNHGAVLRHGVIAVNFNYRLDSYGFLCLGTKDAPGNAGLKDEVAALCWVQRNIASFGGNPEDVTINGDSAGGASVEHLMLSPMARGLFTKAIAESGSALSPWSVISDPIVLAKRFMKDLTGASSDDIYEIENFFKSLTFEQLTKNLYTEEPDSLFGFTPCVEAIIEGEVSFYNESPQEILKSGNYKKVPFMTGFATEEGLLRMGQFDEWVEKMDENFADFLPHNLKFIDDNEKNTVAASVKKMYFNNTPISEYSVREYVDYFSDILFAYPIVRSARLHALNFAPVYLYDFSYIPSVQFPYPHMDKLKGANHCAQCGIVHKYTFYKSNYSQDDLLMQERLAKMWTNFIKFGTPVPSTSELLPVAWERVDPKRLNYLHMDLEFEMKDHILGKRYKFLEDIYRKYSRTPAPPPGLKRFFINIFFNFFHSSAII